MSLNIKKSVCFIFYLQSLLNDNLFVENIDSEVMIDTCVWNCTLMQNLSNPVLLNAIKGGKAVTNSQHILLS